MIKIATIGIDHTSSHLTNNATLMLQKNMGIQLLSLIDAWVPLIHLLTLRSLSTSVFCKFSKNHVLAVNTRHATFFFWNGDILIDLCFSPKH